MKNLDKMAKWKEILYDAFVHDLRNVGWFSFLVPLSLLALLTDYVLKQTGAANDHDVFEILIITMMAICFLLYWFWFWYWAVPSRGKYFVCHDCVCHRKIYDLNFLEKSEDGNILVFKICTRCYLKKQDNSYKFIMR